MQDTATRIPVWNWVFGPALITLGVTVIRLLGELNEWSRFWFNPDPGGGGAPVGIVWLVPIFGVYFGRKLAKLGLAPVSILKVVLSCLGAFLIFVLLGIAASSLGWPLTVLMLVIMLAAIFGAWLAYRSWPQMGRVLLAYGITARVPVALLMLFAIYGDWGTHYDVAPPDFPAMGTFAKWVIIGLLPQMVEWVAFTIIVGTLFAAAAARLTSGKPAAS